MNLKESFRYQNFLGSLLSSAASSLTDVQHCLTTTKTHLRNKANEDAADVTEQVDIGEFHKNDDVLCFMLYLIDEREKLTTAIGRAKASIGFDLDAAVETNKFRQTVARNINMMLRYKVGKRMERGTDYKFNAEGNQAPYFYDIKGVTSENFRWSMRFRSMSTIPSTTQWPLSLRDNSLRIWTKGELHMAFSRKSSVADADVLAQKKNRLNAYVAQFDKAVSLITDAIDNLGVINRNINDTIQEIDDYQRDLAETKAGLTEARDKNDKVIANFQALLSV